jgi:hypothetical protein
MTLFDLDPPEPERQYVEPTKRAKPRSVDAGRAAADASIAQVAAAADPTWARLAVLAVVAVATAHEEFTTDDVWTWLEACSVTTHEPRALGAVMRTKRAKEVATPTERYRPSDRPECHARPVRIWRSKVYPTDD